MTELLQRHSVVDMVMARTGATKLYAIQKIFKATKTGKLKPHKNTLKFGTKSMQLFDPAEVERWLNLPVKRGRPAEQGQISP